MTKLPIRQLPGNKEPALAADVHAGETGIPPGNDPVSADREGCGAAMILRGVKLFAVGREPAGIANGVELVGCRQVAGAYFCVDELQRIGSPHQAVSGWNVLRQRGCGRCGVGRPGMRGRGRGGGLGDRGCSHGRACAEYKKGQE